MLSGPLRCGSSYSGNTKIVVDLLSCLHQLTVIVFNRTGGNSQTLFWAFETILGELHKTNPIHYKLDDQVVLKSLRSWEK